MRVAHVFSIYGLIALTACGTSAGEGRAVVEGESVTSSIALSRGAKAVIERAYTGGATGDTLHKAWICQESLSDCKLAATVDTHGEPPPIWRRTPSGADLMVGPNDVVWDFSNFSYLPAGQVLRISLAQTAKQVPAMGR